MKFNFIWILTVSSGCIYAMGLNNQKSDLYSVFNAHTWSWKKDPSEGDTSSFNAQKYWKYLPLDVQREISKLFEDNLDIISKPFLIGPNFKMINDTWMPCNEDSFEISFREIKYLTNIFKGHTNQINSLAMHKSGKFLLSASDDRTARIWDIKTARCIGILPVDSRCRVKSAKWNQDGTRIQTKDYMDKEKQWDFPLELQKDSLGLNLEQTLFLILLDTTSKPINFTKIDRRLSEQYLLNVFHSLPNILKQQFISKIEGLKNDQI